MLPLDRKQIIGPLKFSPKNICIKQLAASRWIGVPARQKCQWPGVLGCVRAQTSIYLKLVDLLNFSMENIWIGYSPFLAAPAGSFNMAL